MKRYEERTYPEKKYQQLVETKCDLCGKIDANGWRENGYDAVKVEVRLKTGMLFPEGGSGEETTIDLCPDCFATKLVPWVRAQGGSPETVEWDEDG